MDRNKQLKIGAPPGSLVHIGKLRQEKVRITVCDFEPARVQTYLAEDFDSCVRHVDDDTVTWIHIDGLHDVELIRRIGARFALDPLALEDILNTEQRPKVDDFVDYLFVTARMMTFDDDADSHAVQHFCLILGPRWVITFQEVENDVLKPVRERIAKEQSRLRQRGTDYLAYVILDTIVDHYLPGIDRSRDRIEELEERLVDDLIKDPSRDLHTMRQELNELRRIVWPMREVVNSLLTSESPHIKESTDTFLRDTEDHLNAFADVLDSNRELMLSLRDIHATNLSIKMNEIMKVLTTIATIFIPLTFLAGIYGMNFEFMPELGWPWSYPILLLCMVGIGVGMFTFFKKKRWL